MKKFYTLVLVILFSVVVYGCSTSNDTANGNNTSNSNGAVESTSNSDDSFTAEEVAQHSSKEDCWMIIDGSVFHVTDYVSRHPGGDDILQGCGIDATELFNTQGGEGSHSSAADFQLENLQIGVLAQ